MSWFSLCSVPLGPLFAHGRVPVQSYNVLKGNEFKGELRVALKFSPEVCKTYNAFVHIYEKFTTLFSLPSRIHYSRKLVEGAINKRRTTVDGISHLINTGYFNH